eukprot:13956177-Alexandrium_andersonii.AAC.1
MRTARTEPLLATVSTPPVVAMAGTPHVSRTVMWPALERCMPTTLSWQHGSALPSEDKREKLCRDACRKKSIDTPRGMR